MGLFLNQGFRDWKDGGVSFSPSDPVSSTGAGLSSLIKGEGIDAIVSRCGYCLKASMMGRRATTLWINESSITLCQRVRFQRRGTLFLIVLVPMNGPPTRE